MEINAYNQSNKINAMTDTKNVTVKESGSSLDMNDFLNLLVSQIANQDVMNPMENTEFISQLAQFSSLQAMTNLSQISEHSQATSLIGKTVVMAKYNNKGQLETDEGKVEKVTIYNGETNLFVNGTAYTISNVMEIKSDDKTNIIEEKLDNIFEEIKSNHEEIESTHEEIESNHDEVESENNK